MTLTHRVLQYPQICAVLPAKAGGRLASIKEWSTVTRDRPAGLECLEPRGPDRRCRTRWADGCSPMPTDRTPRRSLRPGSAARPRHVERRRRRRTSVLSAKSWMYFVEVTVVDREEAEMVSLEGHPMREMQRPNRIRRLVGLVSDHDPACQLQGNVLRPDLMDMYVSKGALRGVAREARRTRARLDVLNRSVSRTRSTYRQARGHDPSAI